VDCLAPDRTQGVPPRHTQKITPKFGKEKHDANEKPAGDQRAPASTPQTTATFFANLLKMLQKVRRQHPYMNIFKTPPTTLRPPPRDWPVTGDKTSFPFMSLASVTLKNATKNKFRPYELFERASQDFPAARTI
jgi:hypothetical protein